jgi:hypothetical protein
VEDHPGVDLEHYVQSEEFAQECAAKLSVTRSPVSDDSDFDDQDELWSPISPTSSTASSAMPSPYDVPKLEAVFYYAGLGPNGKGPKLVYRTSSDEFAAPDGPESYKRLMKLVFVDEDHELGKGGLWDTVRDQVSDHLDV